MSIRVAPLFVLVLFFRSSFSFGRCRFLKNLKQFLFMGYTLMGTKLVILRMNLLRQKIMDERHSFTIATFILN